MHTGAVEDRLRVIIRGCMDSIWDSLNHVLATSQKLPTGQVVQICDMIKLNQSFVGNIDFMI